MLFNEAVYKGPVPNINPRGITKVKLGVVHIMQGTMAGTDAWFHESKSQVSAHFGNPKSGKLVQWVDTKDKAWAEQDYNSTSISIENEGMSGESLTASQIENLANLMVWLKHQNGLPLIEVHSPSQEGWITHGELGVPGGNHPDCPGKPILNQLSAVIARANAIFNPYPEKPGFTHIIEAPNHGQTLVNSAEKEYYGLTLPAYLFYRTQPGIVHVATPADWKNYKQLGTLG